MFKRAFLISATLFVFLAGGTVCFAQDPHRENIISHELDCVARSLGSGDGIGWDDICYTWSEPQDDRSKVINDVLNYHEGVRAMAKPEAGTRTEPLGYSEPQYSGSSRPSRTTASSDDLDTESWLKNEYPYFYKDHMIKKRTDQDYYSEFDREDRREDRRLRLDEDDAGGPSILPLLRLIDFGFTVESKRKPVYYMEGVLPLFESAANEHTIFTHDRVNVVSNQDRAYSIGFGYRYFDQDFELLGSDLPYIIGTNIFYDVVESGDHYRVGYGFELMNEFLEGRANYYNALSSIRTSGVISEDTENFIRHVEFEQAVDGFDLELGVGIPRLSLAKVYGGFERYDHKFSDDQKAWTGRLELKPTSQITLNLKYIDDEDDEARYRFDGRFNLDFSSFDPKDIMSDIKGMSVHAAQSDLKERLLDRVERNFEIQVERWLGEQSFVPPNIVGNLANVQLAIRFPGSFNCVNGDENGDGVVQAGDGFEIDFLLTNTSNEAATGISYNNAVTSESGSDWQFQCNNGANLPDAPPGGTTQTDTGTDMDLSIPLGVPDGTSFTITLDFTADGETVTVTFGTLVVGQISDDDVFNVIAIH